VAPLASDSDCDNPQTQVEMNACVYLSLQTADTDLNREWESLRTRLKALENDLGYEGWFDAALQGQRGWLEEDRNHGLVSLDYTLSFA